jgi:hypothetical protein
MMVERKVEHLNQGLLFLSVKDFSKEWQDVFKRL